MGNESGVTTSRKTFGEVTSRRMTIQEIQTNKGLRKNGQTIIILADKKRRSHLKYNRIRRQDEDPTRGAYVEKDKKQ